jgi:hypothetical protein
MKFKRLLKLLLEGTGESTEPIFSAASLEDACSETFALLKIKKVLQRVATPENMILRGCYGTVRQAEGKWIWVSLEEPAAPWVEVTQDVLETYKLSHRRLLAWLAENYSTSKEVNADGKVWSMGSVLIQGRRCQVLYYPGTASKAEFLEAVRELESTPTEIPRVLLLPVGVSINAQERTRWEGHGLFVEYVYRLATDEGVNLQAALPSVTTSVDKPGYYFRRVKVRGSWEVGFNTTKPRGVPATVALDRIWLLLRNPRGRFTAADMTNQLEGVSADRSVNGRKAESRTIQRSGGTRARSIADLTTSSQKEARQILSELAAAREEHGEESQTFIEADEAWKEFRLTHGIVETFQGRAKKEGDDGMKEAASIKKSLDRWIKGHLVTDLSALAEHLDKYISRGSSFSYEPETELDWQT